MHCCCAVNAIDGGGAIAGLNGFAVEVGAGSGSFSLVGSCREAGRFAG